MAMVVQANRRSAEYGGHIATYASSATLYEVGFNHFWRARTEDHGGDGGFVYARDSTEFAGNPTSECAACHQPLRWLASAPTALAPVDDPKYAVAVMLKGTSAEISAGTGGRLAGPIAKSMLDAAFDIEPIPAADAAPTTEPSE